MDLPYSLVMVIRVTKKYVGLAITGSLPST